MANVLRHSWLKLRWTPSSKSWLISLDEKIRSHITHKNQGQWIPITIGSETHQVWTVTVEGDKSDTMPIVLIHGMGGGSNMFLNNIDSLAEERDVYLLDLPGFGLSSRPELRVKRVDGSWQETDADDIEEFYCEVLEQWFARMGLDKIILVGHSYGGYLSSVYCLKYPDRIQHLVLADPWGFPIKPKDAQVPAFRENKLLYMATKLYGKIHMRTPIRLLGPLGPSIFGRLRNDFQENYSHHLDDSTFTDYLYACNACDKPSGETGFYRVSVPVAMARKPLLERVQDWQEDMDVTFIFGAWSWMDSGPGFETQHLRQDSYVDVHVIRGGTHHMYADRPLTFNHIVNMIGQAVDKGVKPNISKQTEAYIKSKSVSRMSRLRDQWSRSSQGHSTTDAATISVAHDSPEVSTSYS